MNRYKNTKIILTKNAKIFFQKIKFFSLIKKILFGTLQIEMIESRLTHTSSHVSTTVQLLSELAFTKSAATTQHHCALTPRLATAVSTLANSISTQKKRNISTRLAQLTSSQ